MQTTTSNGGLRSISLSKCHCLVICHCLVLRFGVRSVVFHVLATKHHDLTGDTEVSAIMDEDTVSTS